jgi:hypothetical protein
MHSHGLTLKTGSNVLINEISQYCRAFVPWPQWDRSCPRPVTCHAHRHSAGECLDERQHRQQTHSDSGPTQTVLTSCLCPVDHVLPRILEDGKQCVLSALIDNVKPTRAPNIPRMETPFRDGSRSIRITAMPFAHTASSNIACRAPRVLLAPSSSHHTAPDAGSPWRILP